MRMPINNGSTNLLKQHRQFQLKKNWMEKIKKIKEKEWLIQQQKMNERLVNINNHNTKYENKLYNLEKINNISVHTKLNI